MLRSWIEVLMLCSGLQVSNLVEEHVPALFTVSKCACWGILGRIRVVDLQACMSILCLGCPFVFVFVLTLCLSEFERR